MSNVLHGATRSLPRKDLFAHRHFAHGVPFVFVGTGSPNHKAVRTFAIYTTFARFVKSRMAASSRK